MNTQNWQTLIEKDLGLTASLSRVMLGVSPIISPLPTQRMLVASDYSGSHRESAYDIYTVLVADAGSYGDWLKEWRPIRQRFLSQSRRLAYKSLNDGQKRRALVPFLDSANSISGVCVALAVSKSIQSIFVADNQAANPELTECLQWPKGLFERALRVVHTVSFFVAGLSCPNQDVLWISDEDEIAANTSRLTLLTKLWGNVLSHYAVHPLRHIRCGTTQSDDGSNSIEDLVAIPDLVGGCLSDLLTPIQDQFKTGIIVPLPLNSKSKALRIGHWLTVQGSGLRKVILVIDKELGSDRLSVSHIALNDLTLQRLV